jgi:hypothetical protein
MKRLALLLALSVFLFGACEQTSHLSDLFNPEGIGLHEEAEVQRGPNTGETVTVTGYDGHATVETTLGSMPLAWLGTAHNTYYWCFGQWEWFEEEPGFAYWRAPHIDLLVGGVDLRTLNQAGQPGGIADGSGLFIYHMDPADPGLVCKVDAGEQGNTLTTAQEKSLIRTKLGLPGGTKIDAVTICGVALELMTAHAEAVGFNPLQLSRDGVYRIHFGNTLRCEGLPPFD